MTVAEKEKTKKGFRRGKEFIQFIQFIHTVTANNNERKFLCVLASPIMNHETYCILNGFEVFKCRYATNYSPSGSIFHRQYLHRSTS